MGYRIQSGTECRLPYDRLIMACGSVLNRPDMVGIEHMFDVDKIDSAARLETHLKSLASLPDTPARNTVVVAGAASPASRLRPSCHRACATSLASRHGCVWWWSTAA